MHAIVYLVLTLNNIFYIKDVYMYSPQEQIIVELIKMTPFKSLHALNLNSVLLPEWFTAVFLFSDSCSLIRCLFWTAQMSAVLQKNPSGPTNSLVVQYWTLSNNDCVILRSIFSHRGHLRDSFATVTQDSNTHGSRRKNHAVRAGAWKLFEFAEQGKCNLFSVLENM